METTVTRPSRLIWLRVVAGLLIVARSVRLVHAVVDREQMLLDNPGLSPRTLGMLLALLGRRNVAILMKQQDNMERPSDVQGLLYIPFKDNVQKDAGLLLAKEMKTQGYPIALENV